MEPFRILQVGMTSNYGGIESFIMNVYRNIDRSKIQFDFLTLHDTKIAYQDEILDLGGRIYPIIYRRKEFLKHYLKLPYSFFKKHPEIKAIHYNRCNLTDIDSLIVAKQCHIPVRIIHSHCSGYMYPISRPIKLIERWNKKNIKKFANHFLACSKTAGEWMFGNNPFSIIPNAIDVDKFKFNEDTRKRIRKEYGICKKFVIGHIGFFSPVKNHDFLIEVFKMFHDKKPDSILMLIGDGPLKNKMKQKVHNLNLSDSVIFTGVRQNVAELLQGIDVFAFPSKFEGFGIAAIEAQAAGLPCLISSNVTKEVSLTDQVKFLPIDNRNIWVQELLQISNYFIRKDSSELIKQAGYDIKIMARNMQEYYLNIIK
ncbi:glycosyltransferase family 1 protein [Bacillus smithii]|uniref:glycosyltransferase family 1 protein n=1 Tax=Bacillus smithii TaxID=1479 RepID=UPI003D1AD5BB